MGESEGERQQNKRSSDAQEAKDVGRCTEEDRSRATGSVGQRKGCERMM
jgi:hypothetical protein